MEPTELADDVDDVHTRWLTELVIHLPVVSVGALAVGERVTGGEVSNGTIALILVVFLLNVARHVAASRQMAGLTETLAEQLRALKTERQRTDRVIDEARDPYVELDPDGRVLVWNGPAEAVFGWTRDQMVGRLIADIVPDDNREASRERMAEFIESSDASVWDEGVDVRYLRPDGTEVPIEIAAWSTGEGEALRVHAFVWDISERLAEQELLAASEKKWQSLVSHSSDMTIVLDREGRVDQEVPTVRKLFGYEDNENHGRHFADLIHPQDLQRAIDRFTHVCWPRRGTRSGSGSASAASTAAGSTSTPSPRTCSTSRPWPASSATCGTSPSRWRRRTS